MSKALLVTALLIAPGLASAQTPQTGRSRLDLSGDSPSACLISAPTAAVGANAAFQSTGPRSGQVTITRLVDPAKATPLAASINLALPLVCNAAHSLVVSTSNGGLRRVGAGAAATKGFREQLPYTVSASWAGQTVGAASRPGPTLTIRSDDGAAGQLSLNITIPGGGEPLVAGTYGDQVVIQLEVAK